MKTFAPTNASLLRSAPVVAVILLISILNRGGAVADDLKTDLTRLLKSGRENFAKQFDQLLSKSEEGFVEAVTAVTNQHVEKIRAAHTKEIAGRDAKIAALDKRVAELEKALASARKNDEWAAKELTKAFIGVGHTDAPGGVGGALITDVIDGGPAASAGLKTGDVVTAINGKAVNSTNFSTAVRTFKPGAKIKLSYVRGDKKSDVEATLVDKDAFWAAKVAKRRPVRLGLLVAQQGDVLIVKEVDDGWTGGVAGIKVGDRIVKVNGRDVKTLEQVGGALAGSFVGDRVEIEYHRGEEKIVVAVAGGNDKGQAKLLEREAEKPKPKKGTLGIEVLVGGPAGAVVDVVAAGGSGAAYGLRKGDVLKKINGVEVVKTEALQSEMAKLKPGDRVALTIQRGDAVVEMKDVEVAAEGQKVKGPGAVGLVAAELPDGRVMIRSLAAGGAGEKGGLKAGDQVVAANGKAVGSFDDLAVALSGAHAGDVITIKVRRGDKDEDVKVTLATKY